MANLVIPHYRTDSQICESPTIEIPLTKGYVAVVDECDADLADFKWTAQVVVGRSTVYAHRCVRIPRTKNVTLYLHRIILGRILGRELLRSELADHENRNGLDCTRRNIRLASYTQNNYNLSIRSDNKSGCKGVSWYSNLNKWVAEIRVEGKKIVLGTFKNLDDAISARKQAETKYHGDFAVTEQGGAA